MQKTLRIAGIIAEYNPLHAGHVEQIRQLKEEYGFQGIVVCMSGVFTQRGEPAIAPAIPRARAAIQAGADLVLELPVLYACASAEFFASGAVSLLNGLGIVDTLAFGAENPDLSLLGKVSERVLSLEQLPDLSGRLLSLTRSGKSFPQAREALLKEEGCSPEELEILRSPNSLLGVEYLKALCRQKSRIIPLALPRRGSKHESLLIEEGLIPSAGAIREYCKTHSGKEARTALSFCLPPASLALLPEQRWPGIDAFSDELRYLLTRSLGEGFDQYPDVSPELSRRMERLLPEYQSVSSFIELLKTRELTRTRISRALLHVLLKLSKEPFGELIRRPFTPYARILALKKDSPVLPLLRRSPLPRFTNPHAFRKRLITTLSANALREQAPEVKGLCSSPREALQLIELDLRAERIYALGEGKQGRAG